MTEVSRETREHLEIFRAEFLRWNARINLTSDRDPDAIVERHIEDSLQLAPFGRGAATWFDIGTGGGFPGAVLAAAFAGNGPRVTMVESNHKKAGFLRAACIAMGVDASVVAQRAEAVIARTPPPDVVSARAVASLPDLLSLLSPWLVGGTRAVLPKGRAVQAEIDAAALEWDFALKRHPSRTARDATILEVTDLRPKMAGFSRS